MPVVNLVTQGAVVGMGIPKWLASRMTGESGALTGRD